ncbi:serine hydrolase FSH [Aspergillus cavernicola]|uniref:Serine hydrolase FSH n=1 Tax=Aspergillus cavernicola TaxID=176166 RepID=A0ABR4IVA5_9EURO
MHFLCLHGVGTNSKILEMQTAALRYELGDGHTYDFGEGIFTQPLAPEVEALVTSDGTGFSYFDLEPGSDALQPVQDLEEFIAAEGPYDGVIAFSQGIILASTLIIRNSQEGKAPPFKCAIFFSPRLGPLDIGETSRTGNAVELDPSTSAGIITVPSALIWGDQDPDAPKAREIEVLFVPERFSTYVHHGGHEIPGTGANEAVIKSVNIIRRTIDAVNQYSMYAHV